MITIEKLRSDEFFERIHQIKELGDLNGIKDIYVIPPIISTDVLYLMVTTKDECNVENFFQFSNSIECMFKTSFNIHVYEENAFKESISESSAFSKKYVHALNAAILIENLNKELPLDLQWDQQVRSRKSNDTKQSTELVTCPLPYKAYLPLKRQKSDHSGLEYPNISQNGPKLEIVPPAAIWKSYST